VSESGTRRLGSGGNTLARRPDSLPARWAFAIALVAAEYLILAIKFELAAAPGREFVRIAHLAAPVAMGGGTAAWLLYRATVPTVHPSRLPAWRPLPGLAANALAFCVTMMVGAHVLATGRVTDSAKFATWMACATLTALCAIATAAPLSWTRRFVAERWRGALLALGVGLAAWWVAGTTEKLWSVLSSSTLLVVARALRLSGGNVQVVPSEQVIGLDGFLVEIAPMCSGVDGIGLVVLFQALWLAMARSRIRVRRALVLLPLGAVMAWGANVLRITALIALGASGRPELALGAFHSKFGWFLFCGLALGFVAVSERVPYFQTDRATRGPDVGAPQNATPYVAPLMASLGTALVTSLVVAGGVDRWYGLRIGTGALMLLAMYRHLPRPRLSWSTIPVLLGGVVAVIWVQLSDGDPRPVAHAVRALGPSERALWIITRVAGSCLLIPVIEELAFRGFLLRWLVALDFERVSARSWTWTAVLASSAAFGALHRNWLLGMVAGLAFAFAYLRRGRLHDAVLAHAVANLGIAVAVLLHGRWDLWG
jgi:exosortase E/protease (VPEID-CTERM system)